MGALVVTRGEVWWGKTPGEKGRPFLVVRRLGALGPGRRHELCVVAAVTLDC